ncbi:MAG: hypothetical protein IKD20_02500 [Clostridia bacterium]|nr:hypothetical protein [Clostridia bacterium]
MRIVRFAYLPKIITISSGYFPHFDISYRYCGQGVIVTAEVLARVV